MGTRVLIVEDEEPLTLLLRYNLESEGYEVDTVARGDDADLRLREQVPDLVLLDWMLPGLSGIELCRRIRARRETEEGHVHLRVAPAPDRGPALFDSAQMLSRARPFRPLGRRR